MHKYQGREKECIIISLVDNQLSNFVDVPKMLNVSITRAKNFLYLVANSEILNTQGNVADFTTAMRVVLTTSSMTPNLYDIMKLLGKTRMLKRLNIFQIWIKA